MFPQPRYPGDLSAAETSLSADRRIGAPQCHACVSNPSHRLLPCQHTVCYDHFLAHPEGASLRCARCLKSVTVTHEIEELGDFNISLNDLSASVQGLRLSPTGSIWNSPSSTVRSAFQSLDASVSDMRRPNANYVHEDKRPSTPPSAENETQLGATNRGVLDHSRGMNGSKATATQQTHSGQAQGTKAQGAQNQGAQPQQAQHSRVHSFNPSRSAFDNFPEYAASNQGQEAASEQNQHGMPSHVQQPALTASNYGQQYNSALPDYGQQYNSALPSYGQQSSLDQAQQRPYGLGQHIHAPRPNNFRASHAFRELATPAPMDDSAQPAPPISQYPIGQQYMGNMQQDFQYPQQHPAFDQRPAVSNSNIDPRLRGLQSPVNMHRPAFDNQNVVAPRLGGLQSPVYMHRPFNAPLMPGVAPMNSVNHNAGPRTHRGASLNRVPIPASFGNMNGRQMNGLNGSGHLTNSLEMNGSQMNSRHFNDYQMHGQQMHGHQMHGQHMNGQHMNGQHMNGQHMNGQHMNGQHINGRDMNGQQSNGHQMNSPMPIPRAMPTAADQADPFVDPQPPSYANTGFVPAQSSRQPFTSDPRSSLPSPVSSPSSMNGTSYFNAPDAQHTNASTNNNQQPQTNAARMAEAIKSGTLDHFGGRSPPRGPGDRPGNELAVQHVVRSQATMAPDVHPDPDWVSVHMHALPSIDEVYQHIPFVDTAADSVASTAGVIKIGNIPYGTTKNEVIAALGRTTRIAHQPRGASYLAIHIIMERSTGKTMDCYVELNTVAEAQAAVAGFQQRCVNSRHPRIGDRHVDIELSSQEELMKELFPRAKCVNWDGHTPQVYTTEEAFNSGFQGFVTSEEMVMITKHAETPQRSPFAQRCVNRTYETMISLMHKYPWHAISHITLRERTAIFISAVTQLRVLCAAVTRGHYPQSLHLPLLQEYITACLSNPGFSVQQKAYVIDCVNCNNYTHLLSFVPYTHIELRLASWWAFEVLSKKPEASDELMTYVISLLCTATNPNGNFAHMASKDDSSALELPEPDFGTESYFGNFSIKYKKQKESCTLKEAADDEWRALYEALSRVLPARQAIAYHNNDYDDGQQEGGAEENGHYDGGEVLALPGLERAEDPSLN
ncbi:hypothetical protein D6D24_04185 [Aureobasidium pullulans]|uniref:Uncharacterized protein n=1 Tax=Aureobasidium pullulans TaxID=5580 RepID=A0A4S8VXB6_AURPU|nr:hypothetical protein D6D24_04185 [Aureobasidium pullulans]